MDLIFKALADPARRILLDALREKDGQTLSELENKLEMTRFGVMKHLGVLEEAQLITTIKRGRFKHHYLNAAALQTVIDRWIEPYRAKPAARAILDLKSKLEGEPPMSDTAQPKPSFVTSTYIRCPADAIWDLLMNPDEVQNYHFMATSGRLDGDRFALMMPDGSELMANTKISATPKTRLECTFEPNWAPDLPTSRVVYLIQSEGSFSKLTVEHYDLDVVDGYDDGWARWMAGVKTWLETGKPVAFGSAAET